MPINLDSVMSASIPTCEHEWKRDDVILYHLGLGAGADWLNTKELGYTYEKDLRVLPSYAVIPPYQTAGQVIALDGMDFSPHKTVHGEHEIILNGPIPTKGKVITSTRVEGVYDKGSGALVIIENESRLEGQTDVLFVNRWSLFIRGEEGFGADPNARPAATPPEREPDYVVESPVLPQLAQIYRLSGDKVTMHVDPDIAKQAGFETPLLHGLCTFGIVCKAVVDHALDFDVNALHSFRGRFAKPVFPGETIVTKIWREGDGVIVHADSKERGVPVFSNAACEFKA